MKVAMKRIDEKLRSRIRVIIWKQWKVSRKQIKSLIQLGIPEEEAKGLTYCRKGYGYIGYIKSCPKSNLKQKTKAEGNPICFRTLFKSTHCNIN
jgi:RNA-directed DNA polymerase